MSDHAREPVHPQAVRFDERFLLASGPWLADEEMQALMLSRPATPAQQQDWFEGLEGREDYLIWGIELGGRPIGAFGLKNVAGGEAEYWGYIGEKDQWGRGIGTWMVQAALAEAQALRLQRVYLKVARLNQAAQALYRKTGFRIYKEEPDLIWMEREA